ncbi:hypothetical protein ACIBH1_06510 [Nonomuraea sp. NPDC050663]|uniref:hypothetical protein n=1 Tax=Nonomuraea sp. NPDC050663 TaxID=3364370 RepID=UPI0037A63784
MAVTHAPAKSPAPAPAPGAPVKAPAKTPPRPESVPGRVRLLTGLSLGALALMLGSVVLGALVAGAGVDDIGRDAGPQALATTGMYRNMSEMDALVAESLLQGRDRGPEQADLELYDQRRRQIAEALLGAHELALDNTAEKNTITSLIEGLGRYERLASQARLLDRQSQHAPGPPPADVVAVYQRATDLMHKELLPQAYNLTLESGTIVRRAYEDARSSATLANSAVALTGVLTLALLVVLQVYLTRRYRRVFNPMLVGATALVAVGLIGGAALLNSQDSALRDAKQDSFDEVLVLSRARAISNSLHGDQIRSLIDPERRDTYNHTFFDKSQSLVYIEAKSLGDYQAGLNDGFVGLLGTTLVGQDRAQVFTAFQRFQQSDSQLRASDVRGGIAVFQQAAKADYAAYDQTMETLAKRHEGDFNRAIDAGADALAALWRWVPAVLVLAGALVLAGVRPRLKEYR